MAPFPPYDTDWVKDIENKIKEMEENKKHNYDEDSVVACRFCNSLHIVPDEFDNDYCMRCGSKNELEEFDNIFKYLEKTNQARY